MNKKSFKMLKNIVVSMIVISFILSNIVSLDSHHLDTCEEEHCCICAMIHFAQVIMTLSFIVFIDRAMRFFIDVFLSRLHKETNLLMHSSLVFQCVQLNE